MYLQLAFKMAKHKSTCVTLRLCSLSVSGHSFYTSVTLMNCCPIHVENLVSRRCGLMSARVCSTATSTCPRITIKGGFLNPLRMEIRCSAGTTPLSDASHKCAAKHCVCTGLSSCNPFLHLLWREVGQSHFRRVCYPSQSFANETRHWTLSDLTRGLCPHALVYVKSLSAFIWDVFIVYIPAI
jgi:hypothetical protein